MYYSNFSVNYILESNTLESGDMMNIINCVFIYLLFGTTKSTKVVLIYNNLKQKHFGMGSYFKP